jgi:hypothetical protein
MILRSPHKSERYGCGTLAFICGALFALSIAAAQTPQPALRTLTSAHEAHSLTPAEVRVVGRS